MARTRQKRKAKQRQQQQQQQATRRDATAKQQPTNPAEEAAIQTADALEAADELEEIAAGEEPVAEVVPQEPSPEEPSRGAGAAGAQAAPRRSRAQGAPPRAQARSRRSARSRASAAGSSTSWSRCGPSCRRVQWPDRNQVTQATGVVVVFCFLAGAFLAFWDFVFGELVTSIL